MLRTKTAHAGHSGLPQTILALALVAAGTSVLHAQSLTGGLYGQETLGPDVRIEVASPTTGYEKLLTPDANGRYTLSGLNPGRYDVTLVRDGAVVAARAVLVQPNQNASVPTFDDNGTAATAAETRDLGAVQVSASAMATTANPIDVSTPELSSNFSSQLIDRLPIDRSMESVARLNSNVRYDAQNTGYVSMGGASPAENRYYYNEFDVTNDKTSLGSTSLPAEAISNVQVISGGATASWTNATGGIMSSTIKQGSNQFQAGYSLYYTPPTSKLLNPRSRDTYNAIGNYYSYASANNHTDQSTEYFWASGPLLRDRIFYYVLLGDELPSTQRSYGQTQQAVSGTHNRNALVNLTWNITDDQSFNLLAHRDWNKTYTNYYTLQENYNPRSVGDWYAWNGTENASRFLIGNYHWRINDALSLRLMGGYLGSIVSSPSSAYENAEYPYVTSVDPVSQTQTNIGRNNAYEIYSPSDYWRRGYKGDLTWQAGDHKLVFGGEFYKHSLASTTESVPAGWYTYYDQPNVVLPNGSVSPATGKYVSQYVNIEGGSFQTQNTGLYVEDYWQISDRLMLYGALRRDRYTYKDGTGSDFMRLSMTSPRLGFSWDVNGDSTLKVGGSAGKYTIPLPSSFSFGVAEPRTTYTNYYTYTGVDPLTQAPTGLSQIGEPFVSYSGVPSATSIAASDIKAPYQYETSLYVQKQLTPQWSGQLEGGWAELKRVIEDTCYGTGVAAYAQSVGYPGYTQADSSCWLVNPGEDFTLVRDYDGNGQLESLRIPAAALGLPKPEHKYYHLTATLSHASTPEEPYFLNVSYTWARSYGNTNGLIDEERRNGGWIGQTVAFNYPGIMEGSTGDLAGDIRHSLTVSGTYDFRNGLSLGGVFSAHTGAPTSCLGTYPVTSDPAYDSGAASHYCNNLLTHQGGDQRLPFFWELDLSAAYRWHIGSANALSLQLNVQNVTNHKGVVNLEQRYDTGQIDASGEPIVNVNYHAVNFQAPRSTSLVLRYQFQ